MKKQHLLTFILAAFLIIVSSHQVYAQASIAGDDLCGSSTTTKCTLENAKTTASGVISFIIKIGSLVLVLFIGYRFITAWFALLNGNSGAYKTATKQVGQAILGFLVIVGILGGLYVTILQLLGVDARLLQLFSDAFIPHVYAADGFLPSGVKDVTAYDFVLTAFKLAMNFFIYPALIVMWVWSGFAYVAAQGNPEALKKANQWLMWAVISTIVIFMAQAFLISLRGTVNSILPAKNATSPQQVVTPAQQVPPQTVQPDDLSATNQPAGVVCYSNNNCAPGLNCRFNERGDKGTCQTPVATCSNGTTNPPVCTLCPSPKVLVGNTCTTPTNNKEALADGCGVVSAKVGDRCGTAFIPYGTCQMTSGSLKCQEQTGLSDCSLYTKGRPCSTSMAPYGVCDVKSEAWDNTSYCRAR